MYHDLKTFLPFCRLSSIINKGKKKKMKYKEKTIKTGKLILYEKLPKSSHSLNDLLFGLMKFSLSNLDIAALTREFVEFMNKVYERDDFIPYLLVKNEEKNYLFISYKDNKLFEKECIGVEMPRAVNDKGLLEVQNALSDPEIRDIISEGFGEVNFISYFSETTFEDTYIGMWKGLYLHDMTEEEHLTMTFINKVLEENVNVIFRNAYDRIERQKEKIVLEEKVNTLTFLHSFIIELSKIDDLGEAFDYLCTNIADNLYINTVLLYYEDPILYDTFYLKKNTSEDVVIPEQLHLKREDIEGDFFETDDVHELLPAEFADAEIRRGARIIWEDRVKAYIFVSGSWGNIDGSEFTDTQTEVLQIMANVAAVSITKIEKQMELRYFSTVDPLTKQYNRRYFNDMLSKEFNRYKRNNAVFSIVLFDIDHFKKFNDTYGHDVGDLVLIHVAKTAKDAVRDNDIVCRFGGEEFIILMPETDIHDAYLVAERIRVSIEKLKVQTPHGDLSVAISLGVSMVDEDATDETIVKQADKALYASKTGGRNRTTMYDEESLS